MADLLLPHHVHFCYRGEAAVFLDLAQDDYVFVGAEGTAALRALASLAPNVTSPERHPVLKDLLAGGLLTTDPSVGRAIVPTTGVLATRPLLDDEVKISARVSLGHFWNFSAAATDAATRLRWGRLHRTVGRVQRRKTSRQPSALLDLEHTRELVAIFERLRLLIPRRHLRLYDSLTLIEFLARYEIFPSWIFGVRLDPWSAHCWVQDAEYLFNEEVEEVASYTPVMVI